MYKEFVNFENTAPSPPYRSLPLANTTAVAYLFDLQNANTFFWPELRKVIRRRLQVATLIYTLALENIHTQVNMHLFICMYVCTLQASQPVNSNARRRRRVRSFLFATKLNFLRICLQQINIRTNMYSYICLHVCVFIAALVLFMNSSKCSLPLSITLLAGCSGQRSRHRVATGIGAQ